MEENNPFKELPQIETKRLLLRKFRIEDLEDLYAYASLDEVSQYMTWDTHQNREATQDYIQFVLGRYEEGVTAPWGIEYKEEGRFIGAIELMSWDRENQSAEVGYVLNKDYWNQGIMTEALGEIIPFAFEKMNLERLQIRHVKENIASGRVMQKNGLTYEGTLRRCRIQKGDFIDLSVYSILREAYLKSKAN